jgi:hypothetical protein
MDYYFTPLSLFITFCIGFAGLTLADILINIVRERASSNEHDN